MVADDLPTHGFAVAALSLYKDKFVQINTGESATTLLFDDHESEQKSLIQGILRGAIGDAIVIEVSLNGNSRSILVNCWSINTIMELTDKSNLSDVYIDEYKTIESKRKTNRLK